MSIFRKTVTYLAALLAAVVILPSCEKEEDHDYREIIVKKGIAFSLQIDDLKPVDTKSVINDPYIETKITCITLASYSASSGQLIATDYFVAGEDFVLDTGQYTQATVYAFVNMGDLTGSIPANESGIATVTYDIPAYTDSADSIEERGIPMAGVLNYDTANPDETTISVRRLLAKLAVDLSLDWDATITSVQIKGMNKHLTPFGESWARFASDTFSEEIESGNGLSSGTFVFYIPENEQGTVPSIVSSVDKSGDNSALSAMKDCLTYMEVTTEGAGLYSGTMVYRSYLGKNATSDFSITRNCRYTWAVTYKKDGTSEDDWKHENNLSWSAWRYTLTVNDEASLKSYRGYVGDWAVCSLRKQVDRYEKGLKQTSSFEPFDPDIVTWTTENWSPGNFMSYISTQSYTRGVRRVYSMIAEGSGYVRATIEDEMGTYTSSVWFSCLGVTPTLVLSVTPASVPLGGTFQFSLDMHQESDSWSCLDGATFRLRDGYFGLDTYGKQVFYDYSNEYIGTDGRWTPTVIGTYRMDALSDRYSAYRLESNVITFTVTEPDVESYALRIDPTSPAPRMVGQTISLNAYLDKYINGSRTDITDVTDSAVWSCDNAAVSVSGGSVTSLLPGTFTINVRCDSPDGVQNASVNVTFTADTNYISLSVNPTSVYVGGESTAMVRWNGSSDVTSGSTITAYTSEDGSAVSSIVTISGGTITGTSVGTCYLEASYTAGSKTYHSARVRLDVVSDVYTITLSPKPANVQMGKTLQFNYSMTKNGAPFTPSAGDISWSVISGTDKASITAGGLASGLATGTATVKVAYKSDVATDTASLEVTAPDETYRLVSLTVTPNPLTVGGANGSSVVKYQKYVNGEKTGAEQTLAGSNFTWTSSSTGVATVGSDGTVTPVSAGTATITATYNGSSMNFETGYTSVSAEVTVIPGETCRLVSLTITPSPLCVGGSNGTSVVTYQKYENGLKSGAEQTLAASNFTWTSSSTDVATVASDGTVTPVAAGSSTITATYNGSSLNFETGYTSVSTEVTVLGPLTLAWETAAPVYVAQRGKILCYDPDNNPDELFIDADVHSTNPSKIVVVNNGDGTADVSIIAPFAKGEAGIYIEDADGERRCDVEMEGLLPYWCFTNSDNVTTYVDGEFIKALSLSKTSATSGSEYISNRMYVTADNYAVGRYLNYDLVKSVLAPTVNSDNLFVGLKSMACSSNNITLTMRLKTFNGLSFGTEESRIIDRLYLTMNTFGEERSAPDASVIARNPFYHFSSTPTRGQVMNDYTLYKFPSNDYGWGTTEWSADNYTETASYTMTAPRIYIGNASNARFRSYFNDDGRVFGTAMLSGTLSTSSSTTMTYSMSGVIEGNIVNHGAGRVNYNTDVVCPADHSVLTRTFGYGYVRLHAFVYGEVIWTTTDYRFYTKPRLLHGKPIANGNPIVPVLVNFNYCNALLAPTWPYITWDDSMGTGDDDPVNNQTAIMGNDASGFSLTIYHEGDWLGENGDCVEDSWFLPEQMGKVSSSNQAAFLKACVRRSVIPYVFWDGYNTIASESEFYRVSDYELQYDPTWTGARTYSLPGEVESNYSKRRLVILHVIKGRTESNPGYVDDSYTLDTYQAAPENGNGGWYFSYANRTATWRH